MKEINLMEDKNEKHSELSESKSLLGRKSKRSEEVDEEDNIIVKILKINDEIKKISTTQIDSKKKKLNQEIEEREKNLRCLEKFEKMKNRLTELIKSSINKYSKNSEIIYDEKGTENINNNIRKTIYKYWEDNKKELKPLYQSLNSENKKTLNNEIKILKKQALNEYLNTSKTIIMPNSGSKINNVKNMIDSLELVKSKSKNKKENYGNEIVEKNNIDFTDKKSNYSYVNSSKRSHDNKSDSQIYKSKNELKSSQNSKIKKSQKKENEFNNYSFNCLTNDLDFVISQGTKQVIFTLELENNGQFPWPQKTTTLSNDLTKSIIEMKEIVLESLNPGEKTSVNVILNGMDKFKAGNYCCYLEFKVDGKNFGNNIVVNIKVIDKDVKSEFKTVIKAFKGHYDLPRSVVSDTNIGKELYRGKTFEKACDNILKSYDGKVEEKK